MPIKVAFLSDTKDFAKGSDQVQKGLKEVGEEAEKTSGKMGGLGKTLGGISGLAKGAGGALLDMGKIAGGVVLGQGILKAPGFLMDAAQAAAEDEQATARLQQTVRNLGGDFDAMLSQIDQQIDAGQKLAFSDDQVRDSYQFLAQATNSHEEALKRNRVAMDLARGANISLDQASKLLGKTSEDNVNTLKKLGIEVAEGATEADVLAGVQKRFAGQSEEYAKSTAGQFEQAKLAMGELKEGIGSALLPILTKIGTTLADNLPAIQAFVGELGDKFSQYIQPQIEAFIAWAGPKLIQLGEFFMTEVIPRVQAFVDWLGPKLAEAGAFFQNEVQPRIEQFVSWVVPKLQEMGRWVAEEFHKFQVYYETDIKPALDNIRTAVEFVITWIRDHWPEIERIVKPVLGQVQLMVETTFKVIREVLQIFIDLLGGDFSGAWNNFKDLIFVVCKSIKGTIDNALEIAKGLMAAAWEAMKQTAADAWEGIKGAAGDAIGWIKTELPGKALDAGQAVGKGLFDGLKTALSNTAGFAGDVGQAVLDAVKSVINNYVIRPLNDSLRFDFKVKGIGITVDAPDIPYLAAGGIITGPTTAMIGEAGAEAVIPLDHANPVSDALEEQTSLLQAIVSNFLQKRHEDAVAWEQSIMWDERAAEADEAYFEERFILRAYFEKLIEHDGYQTSLLQAVVSHLMHLRHELARGLNIDHLVETIDRRIGDAWPAGAAAGA